MNWRLHLASHALRHVAILPGDPPQVAISDSRQRLRFYDLESGGHYGDLEINLDLLDMDAGEERRTQLANLHAPNGTLLPFVEFSGSHLYNSTDGDLHLIHDLSGGLTLEIEDQPISLETGHNATVRLVDLERELGTIAALTDDGMVHIFQQQTRLNSFSVDTDQAQHLFLTDGGTHLLMIQPGCLRMLDTTGRTLRSQEVHYTIGLAALSPNGNWLAIGDADYQLIRLYNSDLIPVRQQHAIDLLENARQLQLFATLPGETAPLSALAINNRGVLAFAVAGTLCVTHANLLTALPQPRLLF